MARSTSTNVILDAGEEWESGTLQSDLSDKVVGLVFSDQGGELRVEQSFDGENWDVFDSVTVTGGQGEKFAVELVAPFFQLHYINGATNQNEFRLHARTSSAGSR